MKRVQRKGTIVNKSPYLTSSKKKKKQQESNDLLSVLPLDLKIEILLKLPAKSVAKLNFVSNLLSSIIRGKVFTELYLARSLTRPRIFFTVLRNEVKYFLSYPQEDPSSDLPKVKIPAVNPDEDGFCKYSPPIRGLICGHNRANVWIVNPSTGQSLTLPRVNTTGGSIFKYFGYDLVNDEYKVLYMTVKEYRLRDGSDVSHDHQVFTLGAQQKEWRRITCKHPHRPSRAKGLCMNGVVYYKAWIKSEKSLISFDLRSEEFNVIKVPKDICQFYNLVNYSGKIALTKYWFYGKLDFRVLEDASKQEWSKVSVVVPSWEDLAEDNDFCLKGALSTGELIFAKMLNTNPFYIISYDTKENNAKRVVIEGIGDNLTKVEVLCDHVDSPMFLSNIN